MISKLHVLAFVMFTVVAIGIAQAAVIVPTSYAYDGPAGSSPTIVSSGDNALTLLTDDIIAAADWNTTNGNLVIFNAGDSPAASVTFTFSQTYDFDTIEVYEHTQLPSGITSVAVSTSTDGISFSSPTVFPWGPATPVPGTSYAELFSLDVNSLADAQYLRLDFEAAGSWMALTEIDFTIVPEPASLVLLGLGSVTLLRRRR